MVDTIIFDIGQVLVHFRWREYIKELGFDEVTSRNLEKATVLSSWWQKIDLGMAKEEYENGMKAAHPELSKELNIFFSNTKRIVEPYDYSEDLIRQLKEKGYRVYLLSNYGDFLYHESVDRFHFRNYVDGELISYQVQCIKPDHRIYQTLFEQYGIDPTKALFVDDMEANIVAAKELGLNGILFTSYERLLHEFAQYEIKLE